MYEKSSVKGTGYKNDELIISTQTGSMDPSLLKRNLEAAT
jgi:hypothetical protein